MPIYEYRCAPCGKQFTAYKKLADYREPQSCSCGATAEKIISKPMVAVDYPAYQSPASGRWIDGKKAHHEELKRTGCRIFEPGERKDAERRKQAAEQAENTFIDNSVDKVFAEITG